MCKTPKVFGHNKLDFLRFSVGRHKIDALVAKKAIKYCFSDRRYMY